MQLGIDDTACDVSVDWLIRNYGPRCTLVCAASVLHKLGVPPQELVPDIERQIDFSVSLGPSPFAYIGKNAPLDKAIESVAAANGLRLSVRTRFAFGWQLIAESLDREIPVILNCYRAPSGRWRHSVLGVAYRAGARQLLTLDPNDGSKHWMKWKWPGSATICTATFIQKADP